MKDIIDLANAAHKEGLKEASWLIDYMLEALEEADIIIQKTGPDGDRLASVVMAIEKAKIYKGDTPDGK